MILARWTLDWGDGDSSIYFDEEGTHYPTHVYNEPGTYDISVTVDEVTTTVSISIGTFEGTFADDDNSPFTKALLNHIETPNLDVAILMRRVRG